MPMPHLQLDEAAVKELHRKIYEPLNEYLLAEDGKRAIFEILNALGLSVATIFAGTGDARECRHFFNECVDASVKELRKVPVIIHKPTGEPHEPN